MEERWKRINPLPPLKPPLFTNDTEDLVEVEAKSNKNFGEMAKFFYLCTRYQTLQGIMSTAKVTLINKRDGKERYTRHEMSDVVEMIRTGKLKSGKLIDELTERPLVCFSSMLMTKGPYQWADVYNGCVLLEINSLPDRQTAEEIRDEARFIPYTVIAFVGADGRWRLEKGDFRLSCGGLSALLTCTETKVWDTPNI